MAVKTADLRVRLDSTQKEIVQNKAQAYGYRSVSDFVRDLIFKQDLSTDSKINKILEILKEKEIKKT